MHSPSHRPSTIKSLLAINDDCNKAARWRGGRREGAAGERERIEISVQIGRRMRVCVGYMLIRLDISSFGRCYGDSFLLFLRFAVLMFARSFFERVYVAFLHFTEFRWLIWAHIRRRCASVCQFRFRFRISNLNIRQMTQHRCQLRIL